MAIELEPNHIESGRIELVLVLKPNGDTEIEYDIEGFEIPAALGYVRALERRLENEADFSFSTCPDCNRPWSEHEEVPDER